MKPLIIPTVNLNGTSVEDLVRQQLHVVLALGKALEEMGKAMPHGRDYQSGYVINDAGSSISKAEGAREAWRERMKLVHDLMEEVSKHAFHIHHGKPPDIATLWAAGVGEDDAPDEPAYDRS
jgi:hypothetical protein